MTITRDDVIHVARLARLELNEAEVEMFAHQLSDILDHADKIETADTSGVEPTAHPIALANVLREDVVRESLARDVVLAQAPAQEDNCFKVPRILE